MLPELARFPVPGLFDGELIAFNNGQPDFVVLNDRMLLTATPPPDRVRRAQVFAA